jgi:hypothetical protein
LADAIGIPAVTYRETTSLSELFVIASDHPSGEKTVRRIDKRGEAQH